MPTRSSCTLLGVIVLTLTACAPAATPATTSKDGRPLPTLVPVEFPHATLRQYDIGGSTESDMRARLSAHGPSGYAAYTEWHVRWTWPGQGKAECRLADAVVSYDIVVTFPRWIPTADSTPELVAKWNGYLSALALHENGHVSNVVVRMPAVLAAIKSATCLTAEVAAQGVLQQMRDFDSQYDANTNHGLTQGAGFP